MYKKKKTASQLLALLSRSAGGNCIVYAAELWKDGGFARLSTGIELTFGWSVGDPRRRLQGELGGSPAAASLLWEWSFLYWGFGLAGWH